MTQRFILSAAIAASLLVFCSGPLHAQGAEASLLISNESNRDFKQLYLSSDAGVNWGAERVGDSVIPSGGSFQVSQLACGSYNIRLVQESGVECQIDNVSICGTEAVWSVTDKMLGSCREPVKDTRN